jgi:hypothetical protein
MKSECPFCGFQSSVYAVQLHIDQNHTPSTALQRPSSSPMAARGPHSGEYGLPASGPYPVKERRVVVKRYPVDEPSWIKCGVPGCGQYVTRSTINDHLDMHDMQAEEEQRARRMAMFPSSGGGGPGFDSFRGKKRLGYGDDYDASSMISSGSGGSGSSSVAGSAVNGKSSGGKQGKHGGGGDGSGAGKDRKGSSRKDAKGWSRSSNSGKAKDGSGKSTKSSSSSVVSSSSRGGGPGVKSTANGGSGPGSGGMGGGSGSAGGPVGAGGQGGSGAGSNRASGPHGGGGSGRGGQDGGNGNGAGAGGTQDPFMLGGAADSPDMGGLELQLAKLLLANRANPASQGAMPGAAPNMANMGLPNLAGSAPSTSLSPAVANNLLQALQKGMRPQGRDTNPYNSLDQRVPSEAANLLAALVFSRAGTY